MYLDYKKIIDYLFPPTEDEKCIAKMHPEDFIHSMHINSVDNVHSLLPYGRTYVRSAIHLLKFHNHAHARKLLSAPLQTYVSTLQTQDYIVIPVPLSGTRLRERGYNQVTEVVREALSSNPGLKLDEHILVRTHNTTPQTSLPRAQRLHNVKNAFALKQTRVESKELDGKHLILIDDVMTTGATLTAARNALLPLSPASITCIALAH